MMSKIGNRVVVGCALAVLVACGSESHIIGSWTDPSSFLTWQDTPTGGEMSWASAKAHCTGLSLEGGGWRMPNIGELRTLIRGCPATEHGGSCNIDEGDCLKNSCRDDSCDGCPQSDGPADGCFWPDEMQGPCDWYWSLSPIADQGHHAWVVSFHHHGFLSYENYGDYLEPGEHYVRCVR